LARPEASAGLPCIETHAIDGVGVQSYSREKTLTDCFRFRNCIGMDIVLETIHLYCGGPRRVDELLRKVRICCMEQVMRPYLEVVL
jgi:predicted transcriptional regulator of viral defense system